MGERVGLGAAVRLDTKGAARQGQHEMAVDLGGGVWRDHDAVLLRHSRGNRRFQRGLGI